MTTRRVIDEFTGRHAFLSNFYPSPVLYEGILFPTVEHGYQAAKTLDSERRRWVADAKTPSQAKRRGRRLRLREDWREIRAAIMLRLLRLKFDSPHLRAKLLRTEDAQLIEGNTWGDEFWGVCGGQGENHLGRLLEQVRSEAVVGVRREATDAELRSLADAF